MKKIVFSQFSAKNSICIVLPFLETCNVGLGENALKKSVGVAIKKFKLCDEGQGGLAILKFSALSLRGQPR